MKINIIYEAMKKFQFTYKFKNDTFDVKHKWVKLTDINPPPSYKKVNSFTQ